MGVQEKSSDSKLGVGKKWESLRASWRRWHPELSLAERTGLGGVGRGKSVPGYGMCRAVWQGLKSGRQADERQTPLLEAFKCLRLCA